MSQSHIIADALDGLPGGLRNSVVKELAGGFKRELVAAEVQQQRIAVQTGHQTRRSIDGIGRLRMRIDPTLYHLWGHKLGYDCWRDKQFLNEIERDNPEVRVKSGGTRIQIGYAGPSKRFSKSYE